IIDGLIFRKEYDLSRLKEKDFPLEFFQIGFAHYNGKKDLDGNDLLFIRANCHKKIQLIKKLTYQFYIFQMEQVANQSRGNGITIVIDLNNFGFANIDLDLLFWTAKLYNRYCPISLKHIILYNMPRFVRPLYNRFKSLLPTEFQQRLKFCNDDEIFEYIERKNLPIYPGGTFHHYDTNDNEQNNLYDK
uniref:Uncharacterized protein LOC113790603 n=1 Tax=Dermatophagoides pteronyssinus TaxID=6956 RepID=A0A6P6XT85_DERPT